MKAFAGIDGKIIKYARQYYSVLLCWDRIDPLCEKYCHVSPYVYCADNPVNSIDTDGRKIVDTNGNILVSINNGNVLYSKYAGQDVKRIVKSMSMTKTGFDQLKELIQSPTNIRIDLIDKNKSAGKSITYGETVQGNYNEKDNYGRYFANGKYRLKNAQIKIYLGSIKKAIQKDSGLKYEGMTEDEALGSVVSHEAVHSTNVHEIDADIKYEIKHKLRERPDREILTEEIERKVKEELKKRL